ncbi:MAG: hypothetical protein R2798_04390 [Chitinophagales bacterium]|nr:hypothetical protein [Bacteroidota bacterium]MCB9044290.1 hypothetical protein [Chitinophagales bacterium]
MEKTIYGMTILIWGCQNSSNKPINNPKIDINSIELIDTFKNKLLLDTANSITIAEFHPTYIGVAKNSILLNYWSDEIEYRTMDWQEYKDPDSNDLEIYVDTSQIIGSVNKFSISLPPPPLNYENDPKEIDNEEDKQEKKNYRGEIKSYPVFVKNKTKDTLDVGYGEYIPLIIEAKDNSGNWKPIQKPYIYRCGTGLTNYFLPPNEIIITSCKLFEGDYETKMRVTFGFDNTTSSNEFKGKMNYKQFDESKEKYY